MKRGYLCLATNIAIFQHHQPAGLHPYRLQANAPTKIKFNWPLIKSIKFNYH